MSYQRQLKKDISEDAVFAEHTNEYWRLSDALENELIHQTFSKEEPDSKRIDKMLQSNKDFINTLALSDNLLKIYIVSGITLLIHEAVNRNIPSERVMEIKRRAFVLLSETDAIEAYAKISNEVMMDIHQEYLSATYGHTHLVRKACNYIYLHREEHLTASLVASALGVSRTWLAHQFQQDLHITLTDYILKTKMEEALEWLRERKYSIEETAANLGYSSTAYFSKRFKQYYGKSPQNYFH